MPPIWFCESDEPIVATILEHLTSGHTTENGILSQIHYLVSQLCRYYNSAPPIELQRLAVRIIVISSILPVFSQIQMTVMTREMEANWRVPRVTKTRQKKI